MRRYSLFIPAITCLWLLLTGCNREQPKNTPPVVEKQQKQVETISKNIPNFDGKKAFEFLTAQTDFGPRVVGTLAHSQCLGYYSREMQKYADKVTLQKFNVKGYKNQNLELTNVISSFNEKASKRILFLAHWDSRPRADQEQDPAKQDKAILGANDGASGVAILMEMARQMKDNPPPIGVDLLFDDGEDYGVEGNTDMYLLGTRHFAKNIPQDVTYTFGILLDMVGDRQLELKRERLSMQFAPDIVDLVWSTAANLGVSQFTDAIENNLGADDHIPLNEIGIKTIDLIDFNYPDETNKYWHTLNDTPDKCSVESLEAVGKVLLHVIYNQSPE